MKRCVSRLLVVLFCVFSPAVQAHNGSHGSSPAVSNAASMNWNQGALNSEVFTQYTLDVLDESLGLQHTITVGGLWAINKNWQLALEMPFLLLDHDLSGFASGPGDLVVGGRYAFGDNCNGPNWSAGSYWSLPTGSETTGLGRGTMTQTLQLGFSVPIQKHALGFSTSLNFSYDSVLEPMLMNRLQWQFPKFAKDRLTFSVSLSSETYLDSAVFSNGSTKVFAEPSLRVELGKKQRWSVTTQGRVSVVDTLGRKAGVVAGTVSDILLNDVLFGASTQVGLAF